MVTPHLSLAFSVMDTWRPGSCYSNSETCSPPIVFPGGSDGKKKSAFNAGNLGSGGKIFLGWEDPLEKGMTTHSSILAWRILWTEEPGGLQFMGSKRIRHTEQLSLWPLLVSFFFLSFNWNIITLQCVGFCCTMRWISYIICIYVSPSSCTSLPPYHPPSHPFGWLQSTEVSFLFFIVDSHWCCCC